MAVIFVAIALFMPETAYFGHRPTINLNTQRSNEKVELPEIAKLDRETGLAHGTPPKVEVCASVGNDQDSAAEMGSVELPLKSYFETLKLWSADTVNPDLTVRRAFLRPFVLCA